MKLYAMALRNVWRNTRRSLLSALAITISVTGITFLFGYMNGFSDNIARNVQNFVSGEVRIRHAEFDKYEQLAPLHLSIDDAESLRVAVNAHPAVESAVARIPFGGAYFRGEDSVGLQLLGVDFAHEEEYLGVSELLQQGRLPRADANEAVVGGALLERFDLEIGDQMTLLVTTFARGSNAFTVQIVGVVGFPYASLARNTLMLPLARAQRYLRAGSAATEILMKLTADYSIAVARDEIDALAHEWAGGGDGAGGGARAAARRAAWTRPDFRSSRGRKSAVRHGS